MTVYMLAVLLWRANSGAEVDLRAKELLAEVADNDSAFAVWNDRGVSRPREHAFRHALNVRVPGHPDLFLNV